MNQITIDREGARRLYERITQQNGELDPGMADEFLRAVGDAAAGDFAALAELVGTREVESANATPITATGEDLWRAPEYPEPGFRIVNVGAPAPAPDFREGDVVTHRERGPGWVVTISQWSPPLGYAVNLTRGTDTHYAAAALCVLTHRRHFRAGERCGALYKGQARELDGLRGVVQWVDPDGPGVEIVFDGGRVDTLGQRHVTEDTVLAADWSAPEAVPCEVKP